MHPAPSPLWFRSATFVFAVIEHNGEIRSIVPENLTGGTIGTFLSSHVEPSVTLYTDELNTYRKPGGHFAVHKAVNHHRGEHARKQDGRLAISHQHD